MSAIKKILLGLVGLVVIVIVGVGIALATVDINSYRGQIADALGKQTGRTVKLAGPIHLTISSHGVAVAIQDVSISNASWASKPQMASIGKLELGVALMPLLNHQFVVTEFNIDKANIDLETNNAGAHNWDMHPVQAGEAQPDKGALPTTGKKETAVSSSPKGSVGIKVNRLAITDSQISTRSNGQTSVYKVSKFTMAPGSGGIAINVDADANGTPLKVQLQTGASDLLADSKWPFDAVLSYADYNLKAKGNANIGGKAVDIASYALEAGNSSLHGAMKASLGNRTSVSGTIIGDKIDLADFKSPAASGKGSSSAGAGESAKGGGGKRLFSTAPLDLSGLKSADANLDVQIASVTVGKANLQAVSGKLALANGNLNLAPLKASLDKGVLQGGIKLVASSSPQYSLSFKGSGVDIGNLLQMMGEPEFLTGKGNADISLAGSGSSPHDMASNTNGSIVVTADGGKISTAAAGEVASGLAQILSPGQSSPTLNCAAIRFNIASGVAKDNGILADSSASTVAGTGGFSLREETIDMHLNATPKVVNTGGYLPGLHVSGPLTSPGYGIDAEGALKTAAGTLLKGQLGGGLGNILGGGTTATQGGVPAMQTAPSGQNACVYTLDHKVAATAAAPQQNNNAVQNVKDQAGTAVKNIGGQLKGLFGH